MFRISIFLVFISILFGSCDKNKIETGPTCESGNICFVIDGKTVSGNATWVTISNSRIRFDWESLNGLEYQNIQVDFWGNTIGTYAIIPPGGNSGATFQYFTSDGVTFKNWKGQSGTINISSTADSTYSGTFNGTLKEVVSGETKSFTVGNFVKVPKI